MASFFSGMGAAIRRAVGTEKAEPISLETSAGPLRFSAEEAKLYSLVFAAVDSDDDGEIGGGEGATFLRRTGLSEAQLKTVWRLACGGSSKPELTREAFLIACKLVALCQGEHECTMEKLLENQDMLMMADFRWGGEADISPGVAEPIADSAIKVSVTNPQTIGNAIRSYTAYTVTLSTSLAQYPRKTCDVTRRYSEFEWLHNRICRTYPAAIIPLFPGKKAVGSLDSSFVLDRMRRLEAYLDGCVRHPRISASYDLVVFLTGSDAALKAARDYAAAAEAHADEADSFYNQLMASATGGTPLVVKADEDYIQLSTFHAAALERLLAVSGVSARLMEGSHAAERHLLELGHAIASLAEQEEQGVKAGLSVVASRKVDDAQHEAVKRLAGGDDAAAAAARAAASADPAAASAFAAHERASGAASGAGGMASMFEADFDDPLAGIGDPLASGLAKFGKPDGDVHDSGPAAELAAMYRLVGETTIRLSQMARDHLDRGDAALHRPIAEERRREAELDLAAKRREAVVDALQRAHALAGRRRDAYSRLASSGADTAKVSKAKWDVDRAERAQSARETELQDITESLKQEMVRVMKGRRATLARCAAEFTRTQTTCAGARRKAWMEVASELAGGDADALAAARKRVMSYAKREKHAGVSGIADTRHARRGVTEGARQAGLRGLAGARHAAGGGSAPGSEAGDAASPPDAEAAAMDAALPEELPAEDGAGEAEEGAFE
ncbi:hypothetical protein FNF29_05153 [Cafeteria roenbergensis]|uniref:PX domain-containing protein n=1 Tax=Cafeteria roenbergensis TaxID=33653 RepID=A0A5A8CCH2_CAFRO|nr:hypothetical protein FNF29_05153 [Cafeteria roenbergensis]|eukprot:KAA0150578.1 hypothetical protein FNF29_05153 [Cafeteria roenbergensis]